MTPRIMSRRKPLSLEPVHRIVSASTKARPRTTAVASVFDLALALAAPKRTKLRAACQPPPQPTTCRVWRDEDGTVKVQGGQYPANRWTLEREEQERQRRARQILPKPPKRARTVGRKLRELVGDDGSDE